MKRIIANYYLFITLAAIAQAIFVVCSGNISIAENLELKRLQADNHVIENRIRALQDQISAHTSSADLETQTEFIAYVPIAEYTTISQQNLASLP